MARIRNFITHVPLLMLAGPALHVPTTQASRAHAEEEAAAVAARHAGPVVVVVAPAPTPAARLPERLVRRQFSPGGDDDPVEFEVWAASSRTCGYLSGSVGAALTCERPTMTCNIIPDDQPVGPGMVMCCDSVECAIHLDCLDQTVAENTASCNDVCQLDEFTKKCNSDAPFCRTVAYPDGVLDFQCFQSPGASSLASADFTYAGQTVGGDFVTQTITMGDGGLESPKPPVRQSTFRLPTTATPSSSSTTGPTEGATEGADAAGDEDGGGGGGANVGAIVGGTVGGVAAAGLVGLGLWFMMLKKREKKRDTYQSSSYGQQPAPMSPATTVGGYFQDQLQQQQYTPQQYHPGQEAQTYH